MNIIYFWQFNFKRYFYLKFIIIIGWAENTSLFFYINVGRLCPSQHVSILGSVEPNCTALHLLKTPLLKIKPWLQKIIMWCALQLLYHFSAWNARNYFCFKVQSAFWRIVFKYTTDEEGWELEYYFSKGLKLKCY